MYSPHLRSFAISIFALIEYEYTGISLVCSKNMSKKTMKMCFNVDVQGYNEI